MSELTLERRRVERRLSDNDHFCHPTDTSLAWCGAKLSRQWICPLKRYTAAVECPLCMVTLHTEGSSSWWREHRKNCGNCR